ncbi:hypothetical protein IC229_30605 [Spirosoma sp. BT702]|uniref:Thioredoxin domain-containing protein n=1 Tax=Spirosoma profusum TaxID=2771354 RepID=A0A927AV64_9BACT|nr:hypothetical protein [Spirosoma profusum]MBD2705020.1 hypothetical protein [Spirosoma profusum]
MTSNQRLILTTCLLMINTLCMAQTSVQKISTQTSQRSDEEKPILDQATGQRLTIDQYSQLTKKDPFAYHLVPQYDEYGQPREYLMRASTAEEQKTHRFRDRDPAKQPKGGQIMSPFVMTGLDGKLYRSTELAGKVVVLSFLISLEKEFWDEKQSAEFAAALRTHPSATAPVVLGVLNSEQSKDDKNPILKSLPFVPVPNAYGFHNKFHITSVPTIIVIDKTGKVAANLQGPGIYDRLKQVLTALY